MDAFRGVNDCCKGAFVVRSARPIENAAANGPDGAPPAQPPPLEYRDGEGPSVLLNPIWRCIFSVGVFGVFGLSISIFRYVLLPGLRVANRFLFHSYHSSGVHNIRTWPELGLVFESEVLWLVPLFLVIMLINNLLFQDIANVVFEHSAGGPPTIVKSLTLVLADTVSNVFMHTSFLVQAHLLALLPVSNLTIIFLVHLSLLCSLNAFDYKWSNLGWGRARRLRFIEDNWIYFVGFGMPLAFITWLPSSFLLRSLVFSVFLPLLITSAYATTRPTRQAWFTLPLFTPLIWVSDIINQRLTAEVFA